MPSKKRMPKTTLVSAVRNEAPFLIEWIAYHKVIGFTDIVIVSNDCTDGTDHILGALHASGEITHIAQTVPKASAPQRHAAKILNESGVIQQSDWVCWLDADEFLNIHVGQGKLDDLISEVGDKQGILLHWRMFGDGKNKTFPGRFVSKSFDLASKNAAIPNSEIKTFFRMSDGISGLGENGIHRPRLKPSVFTTDDFMTGAGRLLNSDFAVNATWLEGEDNWKNRLADRIRQFKGGHDIAQINHYCVRTPEFFALKKNRGRGWAVDGHINDNNRHDVSFYQKMNLNDVADRSILRFEKVTGFEMERLRNLPSVQAAESHSMVCVEEELRKSEVMRMTTEIVRSQEHKSKPTDLYGITLTLPNESAELVRKCYQRSKNILEYGSGGSTALALELGADRVVAVESDKTWARDISAKLSSHFDNDRFWIHHADIGPTRAWGRPLNAKSFREFYRYPTEIWDQLGDWHPDVVFIDGRFRAACFLTTMLRIQRPVTVLFDDYISRKQYHMVEQFAKPVETAGRLVRFELKPTVFPIDRMTSIISTFSEPL
ncbi:MAG: glycosyltransferase family 2 protein [Yoonia sp.]